ncbi:MAG: glycosyltransferase family 4 protein [Candidatus Coatesbacteria bacterium]|nr:glycosyltransferase family 4 protein [Candidatus Coatesbacteria bacterium]
MKAARIGIDCRKILDYGIGTITANLIANLALVDAGNEYFLFGDPTIVPQPGPNFRTIRNKSRRYSIREAIGLPLKSRKLSLDLLHWMHYASSPLKYCRYVVSIHDINHLLMPEFLSSRTAGAYARTMLKIAVRVADRIITATNTSKAEIVEHLNAQEDKVRVIHNGVAEVFKPQPPEQAIEGLKTRYGIEPPFILYVGSLREHKNVGSLLEAFLILKKNLGSEHKLVIAGDHRKQTAVLSQRAHSMRLNQSVMFLGSVRHDRLPELYCGADVFVFPTLYEGFGLPPLEAMACGTPVCLSRIPVLEEVAGDAAAFFDPNDPLDMANVIAAVLQDQAKHKAAIEKGLERARAFPWQHTAEQTLNVYREVLA